MKKGEKGILRFYLDRNLEPAIIGSAPYILSGNKLVKGPLAASVSDLTEYKMRGRNLYLPIPYSKRCKITYESKNIVLVAFQLKREINFLELTVAEARKNDKKTAFMGMNYLLIN